MKIAREWWESMVIPNNKTIAVCCIPDIEAIQRDAFDAGRVQGLREAAKLATLPGRILEVADNLDCERLNREADKAGIVRSDHTCSKNTP